ncbi:MAG: hypothetical protein LLF83_06130 [Methanobacterium sp.]|nr:hypothetical protein [Methanobacterium sp.]
MNDLEALKKHDDWNESYYFNFHDTEHNLTAFMRIGNKINKNEKMMFFYLMSPTLTAGIKLETACDDEPWKNSGLKYLEKEPGTWKLIYDGPILDPLNKNLYQVKMDVTWEGLNPLMDYMECVDEKETELSSNVASEHYEQFGRARGTVNVDGEIIEIDAMGERDKSIGVREWGSPKMWMWINSAFSTDDAFNITKLSVEEGDIDAGYFYTNGKNHPLVKAQIDLKFHKGFPSIFNMVLYDKSGTEYTVDGEVVRFGMIPVDEEMVLIETLSRYTWLDKVGYGIAEFLVPKI